MSKVEKMDSEVLLEIEIKQELDEDGEGDEIVLEEQVSDYKIEYYY